MTFSKGQQTTMNKSPCMQNAAFLKTEALGKAKTSKLHGVQLCVLKKKSLAND